jgi:hypothetical protein
MKCDRCGCQIEGEAYQDMVSEQVGPATKACAKTVTVHLIVCPNCHQARRGTLWWFALTGIALIAGMLLVGWVVNFLR